MQQSAHEAALDEKFLSSGESFRLRQANPPSSGTRQSGTHLDLNVSRHLSTTEILMSDLIILGVYRRLDNRLENQADDAPRALELHNRRREALHSAFDGRSEIKVVSWGATDDSNPHEFVELSLAGVGGAVLTYALVPGLQWLGKKLAEKAVDTALSELAKTVVAKLWPKQEAKQLLDFKISLPDGTAISVDPPDRSATITISFKDGKILSLNYSSGTETG